MKKHIFFSSLIIISFTLHSCKTTAFQFSSLQPEGRISKKLPTLEPVTHIASLESAYSKAQTGMGGGGVTSVGIAATGVYADKRVNDALIIFERDVKDNITNYIGDKKGSISFKISNSDYSYKSRLGAFVLSTVAIFSVTYIPVIPKFNDMEMGGILGTALGIPLASVLIPPIFLKPKAIQTLEIEVEILNLYGNVIGRYTGVGMGVYNKGNIYTFPKDVQRVVNAEAVKDALTQVKAKIEQDSERLISELQ